MTPSQQTSWNQPWSASQPIHTLKPARLIPSEKMISYTPYTGILGKRMSHLTCVFRLLVGLHKTANQQNHINRKYGSRHLSEHGCSGFLRSHVSAKLAMEGIFRVNVSSNGCEKFGLEEIGVWRLPDRSSNLNWCLLRCDLNRFQDALPSQLAGMPLLW